MTTKNNQITHFLLRGISIDSNASGIVSDYLQITTQYILYTTDIYRTYKIC